jgi:predicted O-methyltransferase YrrM
MLRNLAKALIPAPLRHWLRVNILWRAKRERLIRQVRKGFRQTSRLVGKTIRRTGETNNFTYDLTARNLRYLSEMIAVATRKPAAEIRSYIEEAIADRALHDYFWARMAQHPEARTDTAVCTPFGRRLGWYAAVRAMKPKVLVETGVERGHGALILSAAILRNRSEGFDGQYFGLDINPAAGFLLSGPYAAAGQILYGDSIETLKRFDRPIDLFINDSDHSAEYEAAEYQVIATKLAPGALVLGDNAHVTEKLAIFAEETGRNFLFFREEPAGHWYPGAGIGIAFPR